MTGLKQAGSADKARHGIGGNNPPPDLGPIQIQKGAIMLLTAWQKKLADSTLVVWAHMDHFSASGCYWRTAVDTATDIGCSVKTVRRAWQRLEQLGVIHKAGTVGRNTIKWRMDNGPFERAYRHVYQEGGTVTSLHESGHLAVHAEWTHGVRT